MIKILTIAGSDSSGGAGIQADLKTITNHRMYGMTAITALTAQNTMGVQAVEEVKPDFLAKQLDSIFEDIYPDAIKIGMVSSSEIIEVIVEKLKQFKAKNIVVDPVMFSTSGHKLLSEEAMSSLKEKLLPLADIITPNIYEAESISGLNIKNQEDMIAGAKEISKKIDSYILIKGGHLDKSANDLLYYNGKCKWFYQERIDNPNNHGTGCTLSSAIACNLGLGLGMEESIKNSKSYITKALELSLDLGKGSGPLNHCVF